MSGVIRWSPVTDLMSLHNAMDRLFGDTFGLQGGQSRTVGAVGEGYLPRPGRLPKNVEVTFAGGLISIKGEITPPEGSHPAGEPAQLGSNANGSPSSKR